MRLLTPTYRLMLLFATRAREHASRSSAAYALMTRAVARSEPHQYAALFFQIRARARRDAQECPVHNAARYAIDHDIDLMSRGAA